MFLFNDALITFYLRLYGIIHIVKDHSYSKKGNLLSSLYGLLFLTGRGENYYYAHIH